MQMFYKNLIDQPIISFFQQFNPYSKPDPFYYPAIKFGDFDSKNCKNWVHLGSLKDNLWVFSGGRAEINGVVQENNWVCF